MRFETLGEKQNGAVLFFHAMGVTGESSEPVARRLKDRYFCILPTSTVYCAGQKYTGKADEVRQVEDFLRNHGVTRLKLVAASSIGADLAVAFLTQTALPVEHVFFDGGMVAQIYVQKYPEEIGGLILISTGGMDANTLKSLKRKYFLAPLMPWYMKRCNYEKLKPTRIKADMSHIRNESAEEIAYAQDMFETSFRGFSQEKDVHISGLLADLMNQTPVTAENFAALAGKILLILPDRDFFSGKMQDDLKKLMHDPEVACVTVGNLSTAVKADDYIRAIRAILSR